MLSDNQKIGAFLTGFGFIFTALGVILFFDRGLLAIGNIAFLIGLTMIIGFRKTQKWLMQKKKMGRYNMLFGRYSNGIIWMDHFWINI